MKSTNERILKIIKSLKNNKFDVSSSMSLADDLYLDSLDMLMLVNAIEAEFKVSVDMEKIETIKTVADIIQYLDESIIKRP